MLITEPVSLAGNSSSTNWDEPGLRRVKQILITYGEDAINSIQIVYALPLYLKLAPRHGGDGDKFYAFGLASNEHFTSVRGHFGVTNTTNETVIRSLCFKTNLGSFGPFGCQESFIICNNAFVFSSSAAFKDLDMHIVVFSDPFRTLYKSNVINNNRVLKIGPRGNLDLGPSFTTWDEAGYGKVKQILISYSADAINSIQMVYERNGKEVLADRHGGDGNCFASIRFGTGHYITSISGHFGSTSLNPSVVIKSLRFSTAAWPSGSKTASYGPFGSEMGTPFRFDSNGSDSLCSFHGSSSSTHLTSIGVYLPFRT
ncbi:jacalin-related lectin 3-like [Curcuma longa]|uniref:jacalin-related lectin 3-like n=1 Tax=Curcuma longa TaxID=136217 RepID=UPI003D9F7DA3